MKRVTNSGVGPGIILRGRELEDYRCAHFIGISDPQGNRLELGEPPKQ